MIEVTRILSAIEQGDPHAAAQLLPLVYDELHQLAAHKLAREKPGQTLQATGCARMRTPMNSPWPPWETLWKSWPFTRLSTGAPPSRRAGPNS